MDYAKESLRLHSEWRGKLEVTPRAQVDSKEALSLAYTPGVAQHPVHPLETELLQHLFGAVLFEMHAIKALADTILNRFFTGDVGLMAGPP